MTIAPPRIGTTGQLPVSVTALEVGEGDAAALGPDEPPAGDSGGEDVIDAVGPEVGDSVVGAIGAVFEGWAGALVGVAVGLAVGLAVGRAVGFAVGLGVGLALVVGFGVVAGAALTTIVPVICSGWIWQK